MNNKKQKRDSKDSKNNLELAINLIKSEKEREVIKLLKKAGYWNDNDQWQYYGNMENNFSIIGNQQSSAEAALVEKLINSIDAVLISECLKRGIHPESDEAPTSIKDAVNQFFHVYGGSLTNIDASQRTKLSDYVSLVATGYKTRPTYSIIDRGEGQYPEDFPQTFLSLAKSNKIKIPFVQGKFNMGGSGVLQFCGKHNMQLIVSKKNTEIGRPSKWGITIVRRQDPKHGYKSSSYTYLAPEGEILTFEADSLDVLPSEYPDAYGEPLQSGTFIKLYEYDMTTGLKSNIKFDLYNRLNTLLPELALPVRMYERRNGYKGKTMETSLNGLKIRLSEDKRGNLEDGFPSSFQFEDVKGELYVFKPDAHKKYVDNEGILFVTNGQTQGSLSKSFFNRKSVGMGSLADSILIILNCNDMDAKDREDLFMNSRDRLRYGDMRSKIEKELEGYLSGHKGLKELRANRRIQKMTEDLEDQQTFQDAMKDIIGKSNTLSNLFFGGKQIENPYKSLLKTTKQDYEGKRFPSFFKLDLEGIKDVYKGERFRIQYTTDAANDYLTRENEAGQYFLYYGAIQVPHTINFWNGYATVNVDLPDNIKVGSTVTLRSELWDNSRFEPFEQEFKVKLNPKRKTNKGDDGERKNPVSSDKGEKSPFKGLGSLPNIIEVKKDEWYKHNFGKEDCLQIINNGELGYDFAINMDNKYLLSELLQSEEVQLKKLKYKYVVAIIGMALLRAEAEQQAKEISKMLAPVVLPITEITLTKELK